MEIWIIIAMVVLLLIVVGAVIMLRKEKEYQTDYRALFIVGVTWMPLGIATENNAFLVLGVVFMVLGLVNRDKWKEQPSWSDMDPAKRKLKISVLLGLVVFLGVALLAFLLMK